MELKDVFSHSLTFAKMIGDQVLHLIAIATAATMMTSGMITRRFTGEEGDGVPLGPSPIEHTQKNVRIYVF